MRRKSEGTGIRLHTWGFRRRLKLHTPPQSLGCRSTRCGKRRRGTSVVPPTRRCGRDGRPAQVQAGKLQVGQIVMLMQPRGVEICVEQRDHPRGFPVDRISGAPPLALSPSAGRFVLSRESMCLSTSLDSCAQLISARLFRLGIAQGTLTVERIEFQLQFVLARLNAHLQRLRVQHAVLHGDARILAFGKVFGLAFATAKRLGVNAAVDDDHSMMADDRPATARTEFPAEGSSGACPAPVDRWDRRDRL